MIISNQEKLEYKKKAWLTPKHPLYFEDTVFKTHYAAAVMMLAEQCVRLTTEQNFELDRLLYRGLGLEVGQAARVAEMSSDPSEILEYLYQNTIPGPKRYFLMLDLYTVSAEEEPGARTEDTIALFARMLEISEKTLRLLGQFAEAAVREDEKACRWLFGRMEEAGLGLSLMELKYYLMSLSDVYECGQALLEERKTLRLVDRCVIREDLVLREGMELIFDHAVVRIYGNIALEGGKLVLEHSRIVRKSNAHRACINIRNAGTVVVEQSDIDCRNQGMFLRAQAGQVVVRDSEIYQTTRGAAIRFWGDRLVVERCYFHHCYSHEDGGAIFIRGGASSICRCRFCYCEAVRGGAVFGRESMEIRDCFFKKCYASEYGAAVYHIGLIGRRISGLQYQECFPDRTETIQYLPGMRSLDITGVIDIGINTIFDCEVDVTSQGALRIHDAVVYLRYPIRCRGYLEMERTCLLPNELQHHDMLILEHARGCRIRECRLDGMGQKGGIFSAGTRIEADHSVFCNMKGGRAIFNANAPRITECIFNYCQDGGVHCQSGQIENCLFVNCRGKSGAGITMLGKRGEIRNCRFQRCVADVSGGAVDRAVGNRMYDCTFQDCISE